MGYGEKLHCFLYALQVYLANALFSKKVVVN